MGKKRKGYILLHRAIEDSDIAQKPPHFRELWLFLLLKAEPFDCTRKGRKLKRGQLILPGNYEDVYEGLRWYKGAIKKTYSKMEIDSAFKYLRRALMVHTARTTAGLIVSVLNYDEYQAPTDNETSSGTSSGADSLSLYKELIKKHISKHYSKIDFPDGFPIELFCEWELSRKKKHGSLSDKQRKTALKIIMAAVARPRLFRACGYSSVSQLLEQGADRGWAGFHWLTKRLNEKEDELSQRQTNYQKKIDDTATRQPKAVTKEDMIRELEED